MASQTNPLLGWAGASGVNPNQFGALPSASPVQGPPTGPWGNPMGVSDPWQAKSLTKGGEFENIQAAQLRNMLAPQFANLMTGYAGPAAQFFRTLMNLGSPFYQQKQRQSWEQGVGQSQNAAALARQQLQASGAGYTPSGAGAAMFGGMGQASAGNLAEQFLQNLFQNEQLQLAGGQGLAGIAGMFNPAALLSPQTGVEPFDRSQGAAWLGGIGNLMSGLFGTGGARGAFGQGK